MHPQRRIAGPDGVILMSDGRAEEGHNAVTQHLVHRALVVVDGFHHPL